MEMVLYYSLDKGKTGLDVLELQFEEEVSPVLQERREAVRCPEQAFSGVILRRALTQWTATLRQARVCFLQK